MKRVAAGSAICVGLAIVGQPGFAECSSAQLQAVADGFFDSATGAVDAGQIAASLRSVSNVCPDDPYTQKVAALGFANLAARANAAPDQVLAHASDAFSALERMHANMPKDNRTRPILTRSNQTLYINFTDSYDVTKRIINTLLVAEARAGRLAPSNTPSKAGDAPIKCDVYQTGLTQEISFWIRGNQDSPGGMNIINKRIANCGGNDYNLASIHGHRARATLAMLKRSPNRADAADLLSRTFADIDTLKAKRTNVQYDWGESDQNELVRTGWSIVTAPGSKLAIPPDQWFNSANLNKPLANMSIAAALDAAYAKDIAEAGSSTSTYRGYRSVIADAYKQVTALAPDQQKIARTALFTAAKMHADGTWRSEANKDLKKPYVFLYNWIDPNYKAAPTAPASAASP